MLRTLAGVNPANFFPHRGDRDAKIPERLSGIRAELHATPETADASACGEMDPFSKLFFSWNRGPREGPRLRMRSRARAPERGMTLIEVMIAMVVMTIVMLMLTSTITSVATESNSRLERQLALTAAGNIMEEMRATPFTEIFQRYNSDASDDPAGAGSAPGSHFDVEGLEPWPDDEDHHTGEIIFPSPGPSLSELSNDSSLQMPRDLNGDMVVDDKDHVLDHIILPAAVRVRWKGKSGKHVVVLYTMFSKLAKSPQ